MSLNIGINGFGRMGRLVVRVLASWPDVHVIHINDPAGRPDSMAHLLNFDSVHGTWSQEASVHGESLALNGGSISTSANHAIEDTDWSACDIVIEASGVFKSVAALQPYLEQGVQRVLVTAPVKEDGAINIVMGVNHSEFDAKHHTIVTAASCTTNCLAPVIKVVHEKLGIAHGSMTTIHSLTNTQSIIDAHHKDLRRARASSMSLIPTTTGSATAITEIFPELKGRLNGHAVRVPLANASLTDCVFELETATTAEAVNALFEEAASGDLSGVLGYDTRPLVSTDFVTDARSVIVDALSTMVVNKTQLKLYLWYDNEWGYVNRAAELLRHIAGLPRVALAGSR